MNFAMRLTASSRCTAVVLALAAAGGFCNAQTSAPATAPAPEIYPKTLQPLMGHLQWTDDEKTILSAVRDRLPQWRETGFFTVLQKARHIPPQSPTALAELDAPAYHSLLNEPDRYRARPIQLMIYVAEVCQLEPGLNFTPNRRWEMSDGPIWRVIGINARPNVSYAGDQPFQVFCAFDPLGGITLAKPAQETDDGRLQWTVNRKPGSESPKFLVGGLFYKVYPELDKGDEHRRSQIRDYPIVMAWQITPVDPAAAPAAAAGGNPSGPSPVLTPQSMVLGVLVVALVVGWFFLRRTTSRSRTAGLSRKDYSPLRDLAADDLPVIPRESDADEIDPLLRQASEEYRKEKGLDDDAT